MNNFGHGLNKLYQEKRKYICWV
jgi:hypothetical protein